MAILDRLTRAARNLRFEWLLRRSRCVRRGRVRVFGAMPRLINQGKITFGEGATLRGAPTIFAAHGGVVEVGAGVLLNNSVSVYCESNVTIEDGCLIGDESVICDSNFHAVHENTAPTVRPIHLCRNVWLGRRVIVLPGVTIGKHSVISAGSVVTRDVPEMEVWGGNPATFIKAVHASDDFRRR